MPRLSGKSGSAVLNSLTWILTEWEYEETNENVEARAAGDSWTERIALFNDWTVQLKGYLSATEPYANTAIPVGSSIAVNLRFVAGSANPFMTDTGLCTRGRIFAPHNGPVTLEATIVSVDGSAGPTFDTSPST